MLSSLAVVSSYLPSFLFPSSSSFSSTAPVNLESTWIRTLDGQGTTHSFKLETRPSSFLVYVGSSWNPDDRVSSTFAAQHRTLDSNGLGFILTPLISSPPDRNSLPSTFTNRPPTSSSRYPTPESSFSRRIRARRSIRKRLVRRAMGLRNQFRTRGRTARGGSTRESGRTSFQPTQSVQVGRSTRYVFNQSRPWKERLELTASPSHDPTLRLACFLPSSRRIVFRSIQPFLHLPSSTDPFNDSTPRPFQTPSGLNLTQHLPFETSSSPRPSLPDLPSSSQGEHSRGDDC